MPVLSNFLFLTQTPEIKGLSWMNCLLFTPVYDRFDAKTVHVKGWQVIQTRRLTAWPMTVWMIARIVLDSAVMVSRISGDWA